MARFRKDSGLCTKGALLLILYICVACISADEVRDVNAVVFSDEIYLDSNGEKIGFPTSMTVYDNKYVVLSTEDQVYLYEDGKLSAKIGQKGRASYEYLLPLIVRVYAGDIYVWCATKLKFLVYGLDGIPKCEYVHNSAISDFAVSEDAIFIYNAGKNGSNVLSVYDKRSGNIRCSLEAASESHRTLSSLHSADPLCVSQDKIYFAAKDRLAVYSYDAESGTSICITEMKSPLFCIEIKRPMVDDMEYIRNNSSVIALLRDGNGYLLVSSEGCYDLKDNGVWANENRYYSFYCLDKNSGKYLGSVSCVSLGDPALFSVYDGKLYCICHETIDDEDCYVLKAFYVSNVSST